MPSLAYLVMGIASFLFHQICYSFFSSHDYDLRLFLVYCGVCHPQMDIFLVWYHSGHVYAYCCSVIFYPRPVLAFRYCRCLHLSVCPSVCVCGNHLLVRAITHHPFKVGSPNLDHRCKRPWLRSLLFWGRDWPWPSRSNLTSKSKFTPFWACPCNNSSPVHARINKFGSEVQNTLVKIPIILGLDRAW